MDAANTQREARAAWISAYPFESANGCLGVAISATTSSSRAALVGSGNVLVLTNVGDVTVYVALGDSSITATTSYYPILPGTKETMTLPDDGSLTYVAGITASGSATLLAHRGFGN
jgi:hypothetical protein